MRLIWLTISPLCLLGRPGRKESKNHSSSQFWLFAGSNPRSTTLLMIRCNVRSGIPVNWIIFWYENCATQRKVTACIQTAIFRDGLDDEDGGDEKEGGEGEGSRAEAACIAVFEDFGMITNS